MTKIRLLILCVWALAIPLCSAQERSNITKKRSIKGRVLVKSAHATFPESYGLEGITVSAKHGSELLQTVTDQFGFFHFVVEKPNYRVFIGQGDDMSDRFSPGYYDIQDLEPAASIQPTTYDFFLNAHQIGTFQAEPILSLQPISSMISGEKVAFELKLTNGAYPIPEDTLCVKSEPWLVFDYSNPAPFSTFHGSLLWKTPALRPYQVWRATLVFQSKNQQTGVYANGILPANQGVLTASIEALGDTYLENLHINLENKDGASPATDGLSPAQKSIIGSVAIPLTEIERGTQVTYLVRFQNLSDTTVSQVTVFDTLDIRLLPGSFEMLGASHPYQVIREAGHGVRWIFPDINLPSESMNPDDSQGFLLFKVHVSEDLRVGNSVTNQAFVRFGGTSSELFPSNTAIFTVVDGTNVQGVHTFDRLQVFPNPSNGHLTIVYGAEWSKKNPRRLQILGANGDQVYHQYVYSTADTENINLSFLPVGTYTLLLTDGANQHVSQVILLKN